jgi:hypothetical protein
MVELNLNKKGVGEGKKILKMSVEEEARRRAKGLCYHCDSKNFLGHKCRNK